MTFSQHLSDSEHISGIWIDSNLDVMYALATRITFICPMRFNAFPMDIQVLQGHFPVFLYKLTRTVVSSSGYFQILH